MTRLIYHPINQSQAKQSPFDAAILGMATSKTLKIACPYLSYERLERICQDHSDWKLLTDVEALFRSLGNTERLSFIKLFRDNQPRVRHNKNLHAKVFIADQQALVGSANLTEMGFAKRAEMSVLITDQQVVDELDAWFEGIFGKCKQFTTKDFEEMSRFATALPARSSEDREKDKLSLPPGPTVSAKLIAPRPTGSTKVSRESKVTPTRLFPAPNLSSRKKCRIEFSGKTVELHVKAGAIVDALRRGGEAGNKEEVSVLIDLWVAPMKRLKGDSSTPINKWCDDLESLGLIEQRKKGSAKIRTITPLGLEAKITYPAFL